MKLQYGLHLAAAYGSFAALLVQVDSLCSSHSRLGFWMGGEDLKRGCGRCAQGAGGRRAQAVARQQRG